MAVKTGWTGRVYEDFTVGDVYHHPLGRTVLPVDNSWFTLLTQNMNPIHFDHAYAAQTEFGKPLVDSTFTLALVTGQSTIDLSIIAALQKFGYADFTDAQRTLKRHPSLLGGSGPQLTPPERP